MAVAESLTFGFRDSALDNGRVVNQLTVAANADVYQLALRRDANFAGALAALSGKVPAEDGRRHKFLDVLDDSVHADGLSFGVDAAAIGRLKRVGNKRLYLQQINRLVGGLAVAAFPSKAQQPLVEREVRLEEYYKTGAEPQDKFTIVAQVHLPPGVTDAVLARKALEEMRATAAMVNCYGNVRMSTGSMSVGVDRSTGIVLAQSQGVGMPTVSGGLEEGSLVARLSGKELEPHEPLFYLVGLTALAWAAELQAAS